MNAQQRQTITETLENKTALKQSKNSPKFVKFSNVTKQKQQQQQQQQQTSSSSSRNVTTTTITTTYACDMPAIIKQDVHLFVFF